MPVYLGTFFIAFASLVYEITLTRLLSVTTWYYLAFFAVSTAMLGMTTGAITVYFKPEWFTKERLMPTVVKACWGFAIIIPISLLVLCHSPIGKMDSLDSIVAFVSATVACALPFYFSGIALSAILTHHEYPIGRLYAADLIGASLGCLFVLWFLALLDASSLILLCSAIGILSAMCYALVYCSRTSKFVYCAAFVVITALSVLNSQYKEGIRPMVIKGIKVDAEHRLVERWNSFSCITLSKQYHDRPILWGPSPLTPTNIVCDQYYLTIDGGAASSVFHFTKPTDTDFLRYDVTNVPYRLRPHGNACIIGVGGGRDIQSALLFGHDKVTGIEVNPIFVNLLRNEYADFNRVATYPGVTLVVDDARSYLSSSTEKFSLIQMSMIDTWAATGAGAFTLSENALYTEEAWQVFLSRLSDDGIFTVSRWYDPENLGETGRAVSLAMGTQFNMGVANPSSHIAMVANRNVSTLIIGKQPLTSNELAMLQQTCDTLQFKLALVPGVLPEHPVLQKLISTSNHHDLMQAVSNEPLNYEPPTDENPYFFNMLRLASIRHPTGGGTGVINGNLKATYTLSTLIFILLLCTIVTIILPLVWSKKFHWKVNFSSREFRYGALYFSLIGAGFMCIEIALMQRLSVFLGHPIYALGILLFSIIASTGFGSFLSERIKLTRNFWVYYFPVGTGILILFLRFLLSYTISQMITEPMMAKILVSIVIIFPMGILLGFYFPTGMRTMKALNSSETPWFWALNGVFGVLFSALAVFISIYFGISFNFYIGAVCYALLVWCNVNLHKTVNVQSDVL